MDELKQCDSPLCRAGPCWSVTRDTLAASDEVPLGCPNVVNMRGRAAEIAVTTSGGRPALTPHAAAILSGAATGRSPRRLRALFESGRILVLRPRVAPAPAASAAARGAEGMLGSQGALPANSAAVAPPESPDPVKHWMAIEIVDDRTSEPLGGVSLELTLPGRRQVRCVTDRDGQVEFEDLPDGTCDVRCQLDLGRAMLANTFDFIRREEESTRRRAPRASGGSAAETGLFIARIEKHKVRKGESIKSLAEANGMTWQQLARFNWGTAVPDEINVHLRDEVGCTKKTADGYNYMFDESDDPGIMYIPREWAESGLATDRRHVVRIGSEYELNVALESEDSGHRLCFQDFLVRDEHGQEVSHGRTNAEGAARITVGRPGDYFVEADPAGECQLAGTLFAADGVTPLRGFTLAAEDWNGERFTVTSDDAGEFELGRVAKGEVIFRHEAEAVIVRAAGDSDRIGVRLRTINVGRDADGGDDHVVEHLPPAPDAKPPPGDG